MLYELVEHSEIASPLQDLLAGRSQLKGIEVGIGAFGLGLLAVHLPGFFSEIVGVDPLPVLEISLRDKALESRLKVVRNQIRMCRGKGEELPFPEGVFDVVCSINVLDHTCAPPDIVAEMIRVTKRNGLVVIGVNTLSFLGKFKWQILRALRPASWIYVTHPHIFTWPELDDLLCRTNVKVLWQNPTSRLSRWAGHGRMSFWVLQKR